MRTLKLRTWLAKSCSVLPMRWRPTYHTLTIHYDQNPLPVAEQLEEARKEVARQAEEIETPQANQFLLQRF
ncbi:hypothetical protein J4Q44_G00221040 [Coregonus suidteri]|uniref:Uncharacterized protein n=1 Tax=Coregonus suidteri TaxID=861788 RepID=A0AAN8LNB1_9TELE